MEAVRARSGLIRGIKILAFFLAILVLSVLSLVFMIRENRAGSANSVTLSSFLRGQAFVHQNDATAWLQRNLSFDDQSQPILTLSGGDTVNMEIGGGYTEPGYTAQDRYGNDLTANVSASVEGDYLVYQVYDSLGNTSTARRSITYVDTTPPEITLDGGEDYHIITGVDYQEPGFTAIDNADGDVTASVVVSGTLDKYKIGTYPITYTVTDSNGNTGTVTRTVHRDVADAGIPEDETGKVIYLTFDDGPGAYTAELLDILDRYNVKATFFVTAQFENYLDMIGEEFRRGHSVAVHSYTHDFDIYTSEETYFEDLYAMEEVIIEQTGQGTSLVRFPGGSSNTISDDYNSGIMNVLVKDLEDMGFSYFDWNVTSGDAGETTDTDTIISNVTTEILENGDERSVVLQHDIKDFSVAAVEEIIKWGLDHGYTFAPLTSTSPGAHHYIG